MTEDTAGQVCDIIRYPFLSRRKERIKRGFCWEDQVSFAFNSEKIKGGMLAED